MRSGEIILSLKPSTKRSTAENCKFGEDSVEKMVDWRSSSQHPVFVFLRSAGFTQLALNTSSVKLQAADDDRLMIVSERD